MRLFSGNTVVAESAVNLEAIDPQQFLIGVISGDPTLLNALDTVRIPGTDGTLVRHVRLDDLPPDVQSLRAINTIFLHAVDTASLNPAQRAALATWVVLGGQLVVSGGAEAERTVAAVADLLPAEVSGGVAEGDLGPLIAISSTPLPSQATRAPLVELRQRSGSEALFGNLAFRQQLGSGTTTMTAFDFEVLRGWQSEPDVWNQVLQPIIQFTPGAGARTLNDNLLRTALQLPGLGLPSAGVLMLFLLVYIALLGPVNYLVLRRLGRLDWAWLSVPLIVAVFAGGLYLAGFGFRGSQSELNQISVVQAAEGHNLSAATSFIGVFSPRRTTYTLTLPPAALVHDLTGWNDLGINQTQVVYRAGGVELPDFLVDVRSVRTIMAESSLDQPAPIESQFTTNGAVAQGTIRNSGTAPLDHVLVVQGDSYVDLGSLAPGGAQPFTTASASSNFPLGVQLPEDGIFNRKTILISLFSGDYSRYLASNAAPLGTSGLYVLAWSDQPTTPVSVDGQQQPQTGYTLYVVKLRS